MALEGIAQEIIRRMNSEGKVVTIKSGDLFGYDYIKKIEEVKDNCIRELKEKGITIQITKADDSLSYF